MSSRFLDRLQKTRKRVFLDLLRTGRTAQFSAATYTLDRALTTAIGQTARGLALDCGAGLLQYREKIKKQTDGYESIDWNQTEGLTWVRDVQAMDMIPDNSNFGFDQIWEREWKGNLTDMALRRTKAKVSPQQYQIFYCYVVKGWEVEEVRKELGVSSAQVYLAKHRVGRVMRKELEYLDKDD